MTWGVQYVGEELREKRLVCTRVVQLYLIVYGNSIGPHDA